MTDLHLLDANVLIDAHQDYYPLDRIQPFWTWLVEMGIAGSIKVPAEIYDEIAPNRGMLAEWLRQKTVRDALLLNDPTNMTLVQKVLDVGYGPDLDDVELEEIGKDPFLIAAALSGPRRFVVTREVSKKTAKRGKARVPDVCSSLGITPMTDFQLYRKLAFSIA